MVHCAEVLLVSRGKLKGQEDDRWYKGHYISPGKEALFVFHENIIWRQLFSPYCKELHTVK